jgi:hypothetical protein
VPQTATWRVVDDKIGCAYRKSKSMGDRDEGRQVVARGTVTGVRDGEWIAVDVPARISTVRFLPIEKEGEILFEHMRTPFKYLKEGGGGQNKDPEPHHIVAELDICEHCGLHKERHTRVGGVALISALVPPFC